LVRRVIALVHPRQLYVPALLRAVGKRRCAVSALGIASRPADARSRASAWFHHSTLEEACGPDGTAPCLENDRGKERGSDPWERSLKRNNDRLGVLPGGRLL